MNTNLIFDTKRFGRLMAYDLKMNGTTYLLKMAAFILLLYIWLLFQIRQSPGQFMLRPYGSQYVSSTVVGYLSSFFIGLIFLGTFIGSSFSVMGNKVNRTLFLQLPASTLEKYLQPFIVRAVLGTGLFFLFYWMDAQLAFLTFKYVPVGHLNIHYSNGIMLEPDAFDYSMIFNQRAPWVSIILVFVGLGTFLYACPLFFRKMQLLKSVLVFFTSVFVVVTLLVILSHIFYPGEVYGFKVEFRDFQVLNNVTNSELFLAPLVYLSWLYFLVVGYFRLKESTL